MIKHAGTSKSLANSLLSKVNSQLKGTYVHKPKQDIKSTASDSHEQDSDAIQAYLNNLNRRASNVRDNISSSQPKVKSFLKSYNKFLKKPSEQKKAIPSPIKSISVENEISDSCSDISFDDEIANNLKFDRTYADKKIRKRSLSNDNTSIDEDDMKAYIKALSSLKFADQLEDDFKIHDHVNTESNPYTEFATETIRYEDTSSEYDSIDEIIESSKLNSPFVSRKRFVDLRSSSSLFTKTHLPRSPSPLRSCLTTSRPLTPKSQLNRVVTLDEDITEIIETRIDDITSNAKTKIYSDDFDDGNVSVCSTNRTDYSYTSSNSTLTSQRSSLSSRRSRPYESSITTFMTTESDNSRTSIKSRNKSRRRIKNTSDDYSDISSRSDRRRKKELSDDYSDISSRSDRRRKKELSDDYSDISSRSDRRKRKEISEDYSDNRRSKRKSKVNKKKGIDFSAQTESEVTTRDLFDHWNKDTGKPSSIAKHVINREALNDLLAHNPSEIAMNDMLKMQVSLTENFIATQKTLHRNLLNSIEGSSYRYTTLDDVKQYIKKNKKPKLSFKEALKQVKKEMGII